MKPNTLKFWSLKETPFNNDINNKKFFYRSVKYDETIIRIINGVRELNTDITMIYGEVGTGKSFTSAIILSELQELGYYALYYPAAYENFETLMCKIVRDIATDEKPITITEATLLLEDILKVIENENNQLVLILDEAHTYDITILDKIRQLSNYNAKSNRKLMSLILVGQTELILKVREMKQLNSRIKERQYLEYLKDDEIENYITFKMQQAGFSKRKTNPFEGLYKEIKNATLGMPRLINNVCETCLEIAASDGEKIINIDILNRSIEEKIGKEGLA